MAARKITGRGGWRPGAGRKPEMKRATALSIRLETTTVAALKREAKRQNTTTAQLARRVLADFVRGL